MKRINENQKVTLTLGQLKRLVKESKNEAECRDILQAASEETSIKILDIDRIDSEIKWVIVIDAEDDDDGRRFVHAIKDEYEKRDITGYSVWFMDYVDFDPEFPEWNNKIVVYSETEAKGRARAEIGGW